MPRPSAKLATKIVGKYAVCGPTEPNRTSPTAAMAMPAVSTGSGPKRRTNPAVIPLESRAGLESPVVAHVLEVQRPEEESRVHARHQQASNEAGVDQPAQTQDAQRHDRVLDPSLERDERGHQHGGEAAKPEDARGDPSVGCGLDDRVDRAHQRCGDEQRAEPIDAVLESKPVVGPDQRVAEQEGGRADREVHEEHPVPAERLGQQSAREQPE